ncbi:MAG: ankyrin repeat domain-containing protein [Armatimonadota bacterium]
MSDPANKRKTAGQATDDERIYAPRLRALKRLSAVTTAQFEAAVGRLFERLGYGVKRVGGSGDRGADLLLTRKGRTTVVQCKQYKGSITPREVRELLGAIVALRAHRGVLVTTGSFSLQAQRDVRGTPVQLIDGFELAEMMVKPARPLRRRRRAKPRRPSPTIATPATRLLFGAARWGGVALLDRVLQAGADVNAVDDRLSTPLHYAVRSGRLDVTAALISARADVNAVDGDCLTPLHYAAQSAGLAIARALIDAGADVNAVDDHFSTPLHYAVRSGQLDVTAALIAARADVNAVDTDCRTPLHSAAQSAGLKIARALIDADAEANLLDRGGKTPLDLAASWRHKPVAALLRSHGAKGASALWRDLVP